MSKQSTLALLAFVTGLSALLAPKDAQAYPEFIGYGYTSCITCHYNPQGHGPLNDYGRAVWASEFAARPFYKKETTDDEIAETSGFLFGLPMPWYLHPGFKYRGLWFKNNPGATSPTEKFVHMQGEASLAVHFDQKQRFVFVGTLGILTKNQGQPTEERLWVSRDHYLRSQVARTLWVNVGKFDKIFGLRLVDHTALGLSLTGLHQYYRANDSSTHGVALHWGTPDYELAGHYFMGDMAQPENTRQKGFSFTSEYSLGEKARIGVSYLNGATEATKQSIYAVHSRVGIGEGAAILSELGFHQEDTQGAPEPNKGMYGYLQTNVPIVRGYNFYSQAEYYKRQDDKSPENYRYSVGLLAWPIQKVEYRLTASDLRVWSPTDGTKDNWMLQAQLHLSL